MRTIASTFLLALFAAAPCAQGTETTTATRDAADAAVAAGNWEAAIASFRKLVEANPKDAKSWHMLGYALHAAGDLDEALKVHVKATEFPEVAPVASYNAACVYALRGDKVHALEWLAKAAERGFAGADHMAEDTDMDVLRSEPRYKEIVAHIEQNASRPAAVQVFAGTFERKLTRMVLFSGRGSVGGVSIAYGQPEWQDKYEEMIDSPKVQNRRWRFGKDEWTTLDASVPVTLGDRELPAGVYYLTLERKGEAFFMAALDPATVHASTIDPFVAHQTTGGIEVALKHERTDVSAPRLEIKLKESMGGKPGTGELIVRFGPHQLSTPVALHARQAGSK
ncbi:MAG: tetratricopeptide repeat protein [Planctomycetota bacterium]